MIVILNREEIEEAIKAYVKDKLLPYGDSRVIHVVQERKVTAKVTFGDDVPDNTGPLPGLDEEEDITMEDPLGVELQG